MAKKEEAPRIILERVYNIPLRRETLKVPPFMKANKAVKSVRAFVSKHMKSEEVSLGEYLNLKIWEHGAKNPPHHVNINAAKDDKGRVFVELVGAPKEHLLKEQPKTEDKKKAEKKEIRIEKEAGSEAEKETLKEGRIVKEAEFTEKPEERLEKQVEEAKKEKAEEAKKIEKEEIKELKKEHPKHHAPKSTPKPKLQEARPPAPRSL